MPNLLEITGFAYIMKVRTLVLGLINIGGQ